MIQKAIKLVENLHAEIQKYATIAPTWPEYIKDDLVYKVIFATNVEWEFRGITFRSLHLERVHLSNINEEYDSKCLEYGIRRLTHGVELRKQYGVPIPGYDKFIKVNMQWSQ